MIFDSMTGLVNKLTGAGTDRDKITAQRWFYTAPEPDQLQNAYRSNWICGKIIDVPAHDMLRQGWSFSAEATDVTKIQKAEKRLGLKQKIKRAIRLADLYGGSAIFIGDGSPDPRQPLEIDRMGKNGLKYLTVLSRYEVASGNIETDVQSPYHNLPKDYYLSGSGTYGLVGVHPSRIIRFIGRDPGTIGSLVSDIWGDSVLTRVLREVGGVATGIATTSRLLEESTVSYYKMKGLTERLADENGTNLIHKALHLMQSTKSAINAVAVDAEDGDLGQFTANFAGLPEVIQMLLQACSGGADIPLTRLLGQSPSGMNATGDSDTQNYYDRLKSDQEEKLAPALDVIHGAIIRSELGTDPEGFELTFNPLWQMDEKDQAELDSKNAVTINSLNQSGLVPSHVMSAAARTMMSKSPAFAAAEETWADGELPEPKDDPKEDDVAKANQIGDSRLMPLYVRRDVLNHAEISEWAKAQGIEATVGDKMHVTIAFSRASLDWHAAGQSYEETIDLPAGGPRTVEVFGSGALVLQIAADSLKWRHEQITRAGASWDWPEFSPHITITYAAAGIDIEKITPYRGKILLGPEIFEALNDDWKSTITEDHHP